MAITPLVAPVTVIPAAGGPVTCIPPNPTGGFIVNPSNPTDQGLDAVEPLLVDPAKSASGTVGGSTFSIAPGQKWTIIPGQSTPTSVTGSPGHRFSAVYW